MGTRLRVIGSSWPGVKFLPTQGNKQGKGSEINDDLRVMMVVTRGREEWARSFHDCSTTEMAIKQRPRGEKKKIIKSKADRAPSVREIGIVWCT